jgi:hypothetical protein
VPHTGSNLGKIPVAPGDGGGKPLQVSLLLDGLYSADGVQSEARRVVAPVLQVLKALHEDLDAPLIANVTYYAAHGHTSL